MKYLRIILKGALLGFGILYLCKGFGIEAEWLGFVSGGIGALIEMVTTE